MQERKSASTYVLKVPSRESNELEEAEVDLSQEKEGFSLQVTLTIRVVASEEKKFTISMKRNANDKFMDVAKEMADFLGESKYGLSFFYKGECL